MTRTTYQIEHTPINQSTLTYYSLQRSAWWRHQMETFSALLAICAGNSPVPGEFPAQRPVTRNFDVFFYLRLNIRLSKQSWGWWFEMPSGPLWRHSNGIPRIMEWIPKQWTWNHIDCLNSRVVNKNLWWKIDYLVISWKQPFNFILIIL